MLGPAERLGSYDQVYSRVENEEGAVRVSYDLAHGISLRTCLSVTIELGCFVCGACLLDGLDLELSKAMIRTDE